MSAKLLILILAVFMFTACASPNDHDYHADDSNPNPAGSDHSQHDTIMGRSPDSTNAVTDSANMGVGDTTLEKTH